MNPIITNKKNLIFYVVCGAFIAVLHFLILFYYYKFSPVISVCDSLIYTLILCAFGIGAWYIMRYLTTETKPVYRIILDHVVTGAVIIFIWLFGGYIILSSIFINETNYMLFLDNSLTVRFVYGILIYAVIILIYYLINYYKNFQEKLIEEAELKQSVKEAELNLLKSQINPHFLFNSLNSINSLIVFDPEKAREMVLELSDFFRYTIRTDENEQVQLKYELKNIHRYLNIEKIRFGSRLEIKENLEKDCLDVKIPNMILQPIFENAIKHGVNESTETVKIRIKCYSDNNYLNISISNNFSPDTVSRKGKGIGLENIRRRLMLHYKRNDLMKVEKSNNIFEVIINIPILIGSRQNDYYV